MALEEYKEIIEKVDGVLGGYQAFDVCSALTFIAFRAASSAFDGDDDKARAFLSNLVSNK